MAIVISSRSKVVTGLLVTGFGVILTGIIGSALGWFDSSQEIALPIPHRRHQLTVTRHYNNQVTGEGGRSGTPSGKGDECPCNFTETLDTYSDETFVLVPSQAGEQSSPSKRGHPGPKGEKGEQGAIGPIGPRGRPGEKGEPGQTGLPGAPGNPGPPGPKGVLPFPKLDEELTGSSYEWILGRPGPKGEPGMNGAPGMKGDQGPPGDKGDRGDSGNKGDKGDKGQAGPPGIQGLKGEPGDGKYSHLAIKGDKGHPGEPGPPGSTQFSPSLINLEGGAYRIGSGSGIVTGVKGESGITGERGEPGQKGQKGNAGIRGFPGLPGDPGLLGPVGKKGEPGQEGRMGPPGPTGTKGERGPPGHITSSQGEEYTTIIKGEKGERGKQGRRGIPGPPGPAGPPGTPGTIEEFGKPGLESLSERPVEGLPGPKGEKGEPGQIINALGEPILLKGEKGDPGKDGRPGPPGLPGLPAGNEDIIGPAHYIPVPGLPGPPGPPGAPGPPGFSVVSEESEHEFGHYLYRDPVHTVPGLPGSHQPSRTPPTIDDNTTRIVPGAVTFQSLDALAKMSLVSPVGTLAFVIAEEALLVRVNNGWQYVSLGSLVQAATEEPFSSTTITEEPRFEASNLVNSHPLSMDGPALRMAALNEPQSGDMKGQRGADYSCYRQARRAGLRGTFRAFIASRVQNLDSIVRFSDRELPVVNIKGDILFNSWSDIFKGDGAYFSQHPRVYTFSGKNILSDIWPQKYIWHGSLTTGERAIDLYCDSWDSDSTDKIGLASSLVTSKLLGQERFACNNNFAVLCVETTSQPARKKRRTRSKDENITRN